MITPDLYNGYIMITEWLQMIMVMIMIMFMVIDYSLWLCLWPMVMIMVIHYDQFQSMLPNSDKFV